MRSSLIVGLAVAISCLFSHCSAAAPGARKLMAYRIWEIMADQPRVVMDVDDTMCMDDISATLEDKFAELDAMQEYPNAPEKFFVNAVRTRAGIYVKRAGDLPEKVFVLIGKESYFFPCENLGEKFYVPLPFEKKELELEVLSCTPRLLKVMNFLSPEEADAIIDASKPLMKRSTTMSGGDHSKGERTGVNDVRTSSTAWLMDRTMPIVGTVERRVETMSTINMSWSESMQVLHYGHKQHYHVHHDFFDKKLYPGDDRWATGHNRILTVFFYLTSVEEGGETIFPYAIRPREEWGQVKQHGNCDIHENALKVNAVKGSAVLFYHVPARNQTEEHIELDITSLHGGCDPIVGEKWAANYWVRNGVIQHAKAQISEVAENRKSTARKGESWEYGPDVSWAVHGNTIAKGNFHNVQAVYDAYMQGCRKKYGTSCDASEEA